MTSGSVLVSVITTTYNGSKYISKTIDSVLQQTLSDFEYIIIDDASSDNTEDIILSYKKHDSRIIYLKNKKNLERSKSRNIAIHLAKGKYIAFVDDDDIWADSSKLEKQVAFLDDNPLYGMVGTRYMEIDGFGEMIGKNNLQTTDKAIRSLILSTNQFCFSSIMVRKESLTYVHMFDENKYIIESEDYDLWLRIGIHYKFANLEDYSLNYRIFERNLKLKKIIKKRLIALGLYLKYFRYYPNKTLGLFSNLLVIFIPKSWIQAISPIVKKIFT